MTALRGVCLFNEQDTKQDESQRQFPIHAIGIEAIREPYHGILCQITLNKQSDVRRPVDEDDRFAAGSLLIRDASLPLERADHETFLDGKDPKLRAKEANRICLLVVENCVPMRIADPDDGSAVAQATEDFGARLGKALNA